MKTVLFQFKAFSAFLVLLLLASCSNDADTATELPDPIEESGEQGNEEENEETPLDTDNDGVPDSEDVDDDNDGLIEVFSINDLQDLRNSLSVSGKQLPGLAKKMEIGFELTRDLDFDNPDDYEDPSLFPAYTSGLGWTPIGTTEFNENNTLSIEDRFQAIFEGNAYTIRNLYINRPEEDYIGLFGACNDDAIIRNLNLEVKEITGERILGGLVGLGRGSIENVTVNGNIRSTSTGQAMMGLLVGRFEGGTISNCSTFGSAHAPEGIMVGGLLGRLVIPEPNLNATLANCFSEADVTAEGRVGGLIGSFSQGDAINAILILERCYATGIVTGVDDIGGLIGSTLGSNISQCYATGNIVNIGNGQLNTDSGGLIGFALSANINSCYASGEVTGNPLGDCIGGLVGYIHSTNVTTSYSTGPVEGNLAQIGGLTGRCPAGSEPTINNTNYWDTETSGLLFSRGEAQGLTSAELQTPTNNTGIYATWDPAVWDFGTSTQYPVLRDMPNGIEAQR